MPPQVRSARNLLVLAVGLFAVAILLARQPAIPGPPPAAVPAQR